MRIQHGYIHSARAVDNLVDQSLFLGVWLKLAQVAIVMDQRGDHHGNNHAKAAQHDKKDSAAADDASKKTRAGRNVSGAGARRDFAELTPGGRCNALRKRVGAITIHNKVAERSTRTRRGREGGRRG